MKKINFFTRGRQSRRGFTLTEILLAVMIVGSIAIALASLTRAASRESGVGRSKIMLRNNLSMFLRTLRRDMAGASRVDYVAGNLTSCSSGKNVVLLQLAQNVNRQGQLLISSVMTGEDSTDWQPAYITYCFVCGGDKTNIVPSGATRGGKIYRQESTTLYTTGECGSLGTLVLDNVKYVNESGYSSPLFAADAFSRLNSLLTVNVITELNSRPIVNDVVEETFSMQQGY